MQHLTRDNTMKIHDESSLNSPRDGHTSSSPYCYQTKHDGRRTTLCECSIVSWYTLHFGTVSKLLYGPDIAQKFDQSVSVKVTFLRHLHMAHDTSVLGAQS